MKRKLKWTAAVLAVLLLGFGVAVYLWPRDRITFESWKKIQIGMTEQEVEELLGGPGINGWEAVVARVHQWEQHVGIPYVLNGNVFFQEGARVISDSAKYWVDRRGIIGVKFDADRLVIGKTFREAGEPNFIDRLRDWLGW